MNLLSWLHGPCREATAAGVEREKALLAEIRDLTDKLLALADTRAHLAVHREEPKARTAEERQARSPRPLPHYVNGLTGGRHVNLHQLREDIKAHRQGTENGKPPVVKE